MQKNKGLRKTIIERLFFPLYSFLFVFTTVNREFLFFGVDPRYLIFALGAALLLMSFVIKKDKNLSVQDRKDKIFYVLLILLGWSLISNISWLWNGIEMKTSQWINQNILIFNNALAVAVYHRYRSCVDARKINIYMIISCLVLVISFVFVGLGMNLSEISGSDVKSVVYTSGTSEQKNLFGGDMRIGGYAEDANYASILLVLGILSVIKTFRKNRLFKGILVLVFSVAIGFSCSKTVLVSIIAGLLYVLFRNTVKAEKIKKVFDSILIAIAILAVVLLPKINAFSSMDTMTNRYLLWGVAEKTFTKSPIIGNGIGSARSAINMRFGSWYVQPHSNYWQLLAETGLIGIILYYILMTKRFSCKNNSNYDIFAFVMITIFGITFEVMQLQLFVYIVYVMTLNGSKDDSVVKK